MIVSSDKTATPSAASSLRSRLEESVPSLASTMDGRRFTFQASLHGLEVMAGDYVTIGGDRLGHVHEVIEAPIDSSHVALPDDVSGGTRVRAAHGHGALLDGVGVAFHDEPFVPAEPSFVAEWIERTRPATAALDVGELSRVPSVRFPLDPGGFDRHTFFCGQSGSGKTYALGTVLERLLTETSLRIVVLDPNSDFVRLGEVREGLPEELSAGFQRAASSVVVRRGGGRGADRVHIRFTDCDAAEQAAILRLDPVADRAEYGALVDLVDSDFVGDVDVDVMLTRLLSSPDPHVQSLGTRMRNLGVHRWRIWSQRHAGSVQDLVGPGGPRCLVVDLGSLATPGEQATVAEAALAALWRRRANREPTLIVIDEAHNVCPRSPDNAVALLASQLAARIAAEGRKFGLYLLISTQRPQRVNELVVSQCDNLVVMRMNAAADLDYLGRTLSFAPRPLLERAMDFRQGDALIAGKIASHPTFVRFGPRLSQEGGSDVPATWASPALG